MKSFQPANGLVQLLQGGVDALPSGAPLQKGNRTFARIGQEVAAVLDHIVGPVAENGNG